MLARHEGLELSAYQDHLGYWTIGYGHLIDSRKGGKITEGQARVILHADVDEVTYNLVRSYPWFRQLSTTRQMVLQNMCFQLGATGLAGFKNFLDALSHRQWGRAANEMLDSKWAKQTPERANELAELMRGG